MKNRKKHNTALPVCLTLLLTACSADTGNVDTGPDTVAAAESSTETDTAAIDETGTDAADSENADDAESSVTLAADTGASADTPPVFLIENPGQAYYLTEKIPSKNTCLVSLLQTSAEANEIIDTENWFAQNELEQPSAFIMEDEAFLYLLSGENGKNYLIDVTRKKDGARIGELDFSSYRYGGTIKAGDEGYVEQGIWWVQSVGDVLYAAIGHDTYAGSCPETGYLVAVDLNDMHVIWKSAPCIVNSRTFVIFGDTILCGYGFTAEPDFLYLINRLDGSILEQIPLKTQAEYILRRDDTLYVRAYDTDYTFQLR